MNKIKLENLKYCEGCPFLYYDEKASSPSEYIGEGNYKHTCRIYKASLEHYLHHPLRLEKCLKDFEDIFTK